MRKDADDIRQETEVYIDRTLVSLFTQGESIQSRLSNKIQTSLSDESSSFVREFRRQMKKDSLARISDFVDEGNRKAEEQILITIDDPTKRRQIVARALSTAIAFWEKRLEIPDLAYDEIMLGKNRIAKLSTRLKELQQE